VIDVFTAAAVLLAWVVFRYDRHGKQADARDAAHGALSAVHYGMVEGPKTSDSGWGQLYFLNEYDAAGAQERAEQTLDAVLGRGIDEVFVVPTEPLARLATTSPRHGLIDTSTVAIANFALWRVHVFNQFVRQLTDFNTQHIAEITSDTTDQERRAELAEAARRLSVLLHGQGIGLSWSRGEGWYGALVQALDRNMSTLEATREASGAQRLLQLIEWPYTVVDLLVLAGVAAVVVTVAY
jgi:hypothetical protein